MIYVLLAISVILTVFGLAFLSQLAEIASSLGEVSRVLNRLHRDIFADVMQAVKDAEAAAQAALKREQTRRDEFARAVRDATHQSKPH